MVHAVYTQMVCCLVVVTVVVTLNGHLSTAMPCTTVTSAEGSRVQCSHYRMTRLPAHLPDDVVWLDMSFNFLTSLEPLRKPHFFRLQHLFVSHNSITRLASDAFETLTNLETLNLSYNRLGTLNSDVFSGLPNLTTLRLSSVGFHTVPDDVFRNVSNLVSLDLSDNSLSRIPSAALQYASSLQHLDMSRNSLTTIHNHSLSSLSSLQHLVLQSNQLTSLQPAAFVGLEKLTTLDLRFNQLGFEYGYPPHVFEPLLSLKNLYIYGNSDEDEGEYPDGVFDPLQSLEALSLDSFSDPQFQGAFKNLTKLTSLTFASLRSKGCHMKRIRNNTFSEFHGSELQSLTFESCPLFRVEYCAFCFLPRLSRLTISGSHYVRLVDLLTALYGLQHQTLQELAFNWIHYPVPNVVDRKAMRYLNKMCVQKLIMTSCKIVGITLRAFDYNGRLCECLKYVDLSYNAVSGGYSELMKLSVGLVAIEYFAMHNQEFFFVGFKHTDHPKPERPRRRTDTVIYINTASSLRYMNVSAGLWKISAINTHIHFSHAGNLTVLDMSYCGAYSCDTVITGLTNIRTLDFSGNDCYVMGDWLFQHMPTLEGLRLSDVVLQEQFIMSNGTSLFSHLWNLEELDLSSNNLHRLPSDLLQHQPHLKRLILAGNQFEGLPLDLSLHPFLQDLDLRDNMIHILSPSERQILNSLADNHTFTLRLRGNPLSCTCQALDMVSWLATTTVRLDGDNNNDGFDDDYDDNRRDYPCVLEDGSVSSTWQVMVSWESHWRHCVGLFFFTVALVAQLLQMLAVLITYLLWNKWTFLRHKWHVLRHVQLPCRADFEHDALLVYASDEHGMAARMKAILTDLRPGLRLALQEDEIPLGRFWTDIIPEAMEKSWKIIVLVTQDFMEDDLSGYTVLHVQAKISDVMPNRVLLLYVGDLRPGDMDGPAPLSLRRLLHVLPESNVCHVPRDIVRRPAHPVWEFLIQKVLHE